MLNWYTFTSSKISGLAEMSFEAMSLLLGSGILGVPTSLEGSLSLLFVKMLGSPSSLEGSLSLLSVKTLGVPSSLDGPGLGSSGSSTGSAS